MPALYGIPTWFAIQCPKILWPKVLHPHVCCVHSLCSLPLSSPTYFTAQEDDRSHEIDDDTVNPPDVRSYQLLPKKRPHTLVVELPIGQIVSGAELHSMLVLSWNLFNVASGRRNAYLWENLKITYDEFMNVCISKCLFSRFCFFLFTCPTRILLLISHLKSSC